MEQGMRWGWKRLCLFLSSWLHLSSASSQTQSLHGYYIYLMLPRGACLLAYRFWLSAKWHPNSVQLFCKGTLRSWAPFRCLVHCCTPSQSHFHLCRSCCGLAVSSCGGCRSVPRLCTSAGPHAQTIPIHAWPLSSNSFNIFWPELHRAIHLQVFHYLDCTGEIQRLMALCHSI